MTKGNRTAWALPAILALGLLLRGLYLAEIADSPETRAPALDAAFHDHWARALLSGDWSQPKFFADPQIHSTPYFRPPAYPFLLAALYSLSNGSPLGARALQMALGLLSVWLGFRLARALFDHTTGLVAAAGLASTWSLIYFEGELLAPVLLVLLVLASLLALLRWWHRGGFCASGGAGLLLGLLALSSPNWLALIPVVFVWSIWTARRPHAPATARRTAWYLPLGAMLAIAPATIRNYVVAGDLVLITSNGGVNLYIGNNAEADGHTARIPILGALAPLRGWTCFDQPAIVRGIERLEQRQLTASAVSRFFTHRALDYAAAAPGAAFALAAKKAALFWGPLEVANNRELEVVRATSNVLRWLPSFPWVLSLCVVGGALLFCDLRRAARNHRHDFGVLLLAIVVVYFASHLPFFVAGRYRAPLLPILWLGAAYGIAQVILQLRAGKVRKAASCIVGWLALLALAHVEMTDYRPDPGNFHFQRGDAFRMCGDLDAAITEFQLAITTSAERDPQPYNNLGAALLQKGRSPEAIESFRRALLLDASYVQARVNLALALAGIGKDDLARQELEQVVQQAPDLVMARTQLGAILLRLGRPADAVPQFEASLRLAPGEPSTRYLLALALLDVGRAADSRSELEKLLVAAPRFVDAYVMLAELAAQAGDRQRARTLVQQALAIDPRHAGALAMREQWK